MVTEVFWIWYAVTVALCFVVMFCAEKYILGTVTVGAAFSIFLGSLIPVLNVVLIIVAIVMTGLHWSARGGKANVLNQRLW